MVRVMRHFPFAAALAVALAVSAAAAQARDPASPQRSVTPPLQYRLDGLPDDQLSYRGRAYAPARPVDGRSGPAPTGGYVAGGFYYPPPVTTTTVIQYRPACP